MPDFPAGFEPHHRFDYFEPGDKTALLCLDVPEMQRIAIEQLDALGYKVHTGLFLDDSVLKLRAQPYDVVIVSDVFAGGSLGNHTIIKEASRLPAAQRRQLTLVLLGSGLSTNDELQAFAHNVDLVVSLGDLVNLKPVLRRAVARGVELNAPLHETLAILQTEERRGMRAGRGVAGGWTGGWRAGKLLRLANVARPHTTCSPAGLVENSGGSATNAGAPPSSGHDARNMGRHPTGKATLGT